MMVAEATRLFVALHTDEDVTADLAPALRRRGYKAQSTAEAGNFCAVGMIVRSFVSQSDHFPIIYAF